MNDFQFDTSITPMQRYLTFKALKIGKSIAFPKGNGEILGGKETYKSDQQTQESVGKERENEGPVETEIGDEKSSHTRKQVEFAQKNQRYASEGSKRLDAVYREVEQ